MSFENKIQQWVQLDNQLKQINEKTKELREKRSILEENITSYASINNLSNTTVQISDGKLKFADTKVTEPLTFTVSINAWGMSDVILQVDTIAKQITAFI